MYIVFLIFNVLDEKVEEVIGIYKNCLKLVDEVLGFVDFLFF